MKQFIITLSFFLFSHSLLASSTSERDNRITERWRLSYLRVKKENPVDFFLDERNEYAELSGVYGQSNDDCFFRLTSLGNYRQGMQFRFANYTYIDTLHCFYSRAGYTNSRTKGISRNLTSDYWRLFPYVMGDSSIGDRNEEHYDFMLGYLYQPTRWIIGTQLSYQAKNEYQTHDPRPHNITSDLGLRGSLGYALNRDYWIALSVAWQRYTQRNQVAFLGEAGNAPIAHYLGFGKEHSRFSGSNNHVFYRGNGWNTEIILGTKEDIGWRLRLNYRQEGIEKLLTGLNDLKLNKITHSIYQGVLSYGDSLGCSTWKVGLDIGTQYRKGSEFIYGEGTGNSYPQLGREDPFQFTNYYYRLEGQIENNERSFAWGIAPSITYATCKMERYSDYVNIRLIAPVLDIVTSKNIKKWLLACRGTFTYYRLLDEKYDVEQVRAMESIKTLLSDRVDSELKLALCYSLKKEISFTIWTKGAYRLRLHDKQRNLEGQIGFGIIF